MGILTEREGDFTYPSVRKCKNSTSYVTANAGSASAVAAKVKEEAPTLYLQGFHNRAGKWVNLYKVNGADAGREALKQCMYKGQPAPDKVIIVWEHFSAYRIEEMTLVRLRY